MTLAPGSRDGNKTRRPKKVEKPEKILEWCRGGSRKKRRRSGGETRSGRSWTSGASKDIRQVYTPVCRRGYQAFNLEFGYGDNEKRCAL